LPRKRICREPWGKPSQRSAGAGRFEICDDAAFVEENSWAGIFVVAVISVTTAAPDRTLGSVLRDLHDGLMRWPLWWLLATLDIKQRYRRSRMGQLWLTISMGVTILALGLVYPLIFHIRIGGYLPSVAVGFVVWTLISCLVTEGSLAFISAAPFLKQSSEPRSIYVYRVLVRNGLVFLHNTLIIAITFLIFRVPLTWAMWASVLGLGLLFIAAGWVVLLLGALSARFRDLPQIAASFIQVVFFVTPIMWQPSMLPADKHWIIHVNPFAAFISVIREPLLGSIPDLTTWLIALAWALAGYVVVIPFFARFRARIVYWL
jgi:ABC-type polysaccharide/polyol phosphate export permease